MLLIMLIMQMNIGLKRHSAHLTFHKVSGLKYNSHNENCSQLRIIIKILCYNYSSIKMQT